MAKKYTVAIIGIGGRGGDAYGALMNEAPEKFDIVALCDLKPDRLALFAERFGVAKENTFTDEKEFFEKRRADVLVIATPDADHIRHATYAFNVGYDVLLEKPISDKKEELEKLLDLQKKTGCKAFVCHVLRYAPAFVKIAELLDSGIIGKLVAIQALERVGHSHQAHSYVRGNWRRAEDSTPMILAKCCHDLDLLQFYAGSKCESVSSIGELSHFKAENAPEGATERCLDCPHADGGCPYSAKRQYYTVWKEIGCPEDVWPYNIIALAPLTEEKLLTALREGPYGRCVYHCDNNVVDHQITQMTFENGVKATLTMTAFTAGGGRRMDFFGTHGQLTLDEKTNSIYVGLYCKDGETIALQDLTEKGYGHGGGDYHLVHTLYKILEGEVTGNTSLDRSVESHLIGIAAEESRLAGGKLIKVH